MKRTTALPLLALVAALALPATAFAESDIVGQTALKFGGYYPAIDSEFSGATPFQEYFGSEDLWYVESAWDFYLWRKYVKVGLGFSFGYASTEGTVQTTATTTTEDLGKTSFGVLPLKANLLLRYDHSALHHGIPLVPYVKGGLGYHLWWVNDDTNSTAVSGDTRAQGGKFGVHGSLGLQFMLDFIDPSRAAAFDESFGVNHSYLFAEYSLVRVGNTGTGLNLSDDQVLFGLAFEY